MTIKKSRYISFLFIIFFLFFVSLNPILAQVQTDKTASENQYFSPDELKRADTIIYFISSPEVVYTVLLTFSLLIVFATYFVIVGLIVILFFGRFL